MIRVVGPDGKKLAPTEKYDYIYKKLMNKEAIVVKDKPFTVKILKFGSAKVEQSKVPISDRSRRNNENKRRLARFEAIKEKFNDNEQTHFASR